MRVIVINTGTEILLGDVLNTHLAFIAREIFQFGLRISEQRTIPDGATIQSALADVSLRAEIVFVTGGLGPTSDDITREIVAGYLQLPLVEDVIVREGIRSRLAARRIPTTKRIWRQALVPAGADVLPNENGTAPGLYLPANINPGVPSPHLFLLPGPPRELQPMFRNFVAPVLGRITTGSKKAAMRTFRIANMGESIIEKKIGDLVLAIQGVELGYCARPGEVEVRVIGSATAVKLFAKNWATRSSARAMRLWRPFLSVCFRSRSKLWRWPSHARAVFWQIKSPMFRVPRKYLLLATLPIRIKRKFVASVFRANRSRNSAP